MNCEQLYFRLISWAVGWFFLHPFFFFFFLYPWHLLWKWLLECLRYEVRPWGGSSLCRSTPCHCSITEMHSSHSGPCASKQGTSGFGPLVAVYNSVLHKCTWRILRHLSELPCSANSAYKNPLDCAETSFSCLLIKCSCSIFYWSTSSKQN